MYVEEMLEIQRKCRKLAKKIVKRAYRTYDAIWIQRIKVTPELEEMGEGIVGKINGRMPNLLLRNQDGMDINETALAWGFASGKALAEYLAAYEPRKKHEENIYHRLVAKKFSKLVGKEFEAACNTPTSLLSAIVGRCKKCAKEYTQAAYALYDEIWYGKIRITPELLKYGNEIVSELNGKMPNLLTYEKCCSAIDQVMMEYNFDSVQALVDWLLDYTPRGPYQSELAEKMMREELGLDECLSLPNDDFTQGAGNCNLDELPF